MGICRSSCAHSDLEYYDAWGHKPARSLYSTRSRLAAASGDTKLWMCARGCCSIQWKLDYAEFQSYLKYAAVSPYVVIQDKTRECRCVICCGLSESPSESSALPLDLHTLPPSHVAPSASMGEPTPRKWRRKSPQDSSCSLTDVCSTDDEDGE